MKRFLFIICAIYTLFSAEKTYSQFLLQGELRPRFEVFNGYKKLPEDLSSPILMISQRSRMYINYETSKIKSKISFQDVRFIGNDVVKTETSLFGLHEAWVRISLFDSLSIKVGMQELSYENKRLIDNGGWSQAGTSHNALVFSYLKKGLQLDFVSAFNASPDTAIILKTPNSYRTLNILWLSKKLSNAFQISLMGITDGYQKNNTTQTIYLRGTFGGIIRYKKDTKLTASLRGFYQTGRLQNGQEIAAYYHQADMNYVFNSKLNATIGYEYISGTNGLDYANKKSNSFNLLYGSSHAFNGNLKYFSSLLKNKKNPGLINPYLHLFYKLQDKWQARADFHYFRMQNNYVVNTTAIDKYLGIEADLSLKYDFYKEASVMFGFSIMRPEKTMEPIVGGNSSYYGTWGFIMLTFKPTLFSQN
ncbi:MAG TPA: alginate export family protein [Bacteroidales bacterium]|nr:alginate export family protein [Bacteroidales bacterium]